MNYTATYSPDDNKLRLYAGGRLPADVYARVKAAGFAWAPRQELFVAPMWTPSREDLLIELAGEIGDEDTSLADRAEQRAERFEDYSEKRADDAESARAAVARIADGIPMGQPILVGHHSEKHARKDAEKIENGMRRAVKMWETSKYWTDRAAGAIGHAAYKERSDVRARRIKGIEADLRKQERSTADANKFLQLWRKIDDPDAIKKKDGSASTITERALYVANFDHVSMCFTLAKYPAAEGANAYEGAQSLWSALDNGRITAEQARDLAIEAHERGNAHRARWIQHYKNRLAYERAMLADAGGTATDKTGPMKGGACQCWASPRGGGWSYIQKVNKISVTVLDNWQNPNDRDGGRNFTRTIPFDKLGAVMSPLEVDNARQAGTLQESRDKTGFYLSQPKPPKVDTVCPDGPACPDTECKTERTRQGLPASDFEAMKESLRAGVQVVSAPQLFPTPDALADRMAALADIKPGHSVLEPSAGTGQLIRAVQALGLNGAVRLEVCELNMRLADALASKFKGVPIIPGDFLEKTAFEFGGLVDRVVMNPPFGDAADIKHIRHALDLLKPGGRLVAICANGPRQQAALQPLADMWEALPRDTFSGTSVGAALLVISKAA